MGLRINAHSYIDKRSALEKLEKYEEQRPLSQNPESWGIRDCNTIAHVMVSFINNLQTFLFFKSCYGINYEGK